MLVLAISAAKNNIMLMITELNERSKEIFRYIVDAYMATGEPVGSRTISKELGLNLSAATIRNVMADLESEGLLFAPHTSAGRMPTQQGLRFYVDGLMEIGNLTNEEQQQIKAQCLAAGHSMEALYDQATTMLSGLSSAAGLVVAPKMEKPLRQIQFVRLEARRVLIIMVMESGLVENRVMEVDHDVSESSLQMAANYLNSRLAGKTVPQAQAVIKDEIDTNKAQLDSLTADLVKRGISAAPPNLSTGHIIVRGQTRLLQDVRAIEDLEKARKLLELLEEQETMAQLLQSVETAEGVQIYIGTENKMFEHSGWSVVISPYKNNESEIIGAIGVIGPTRLNYSRIIPLLDYTSKVIQKIVSS